MNDAVISAVGRLTLKLIVANQVASRDQVSSHVKVPMIKNFPGRSPGDGAR